MIYYNNKKKNNKYVKTNRNNTSELLNSKKTKKSLILNYDGGKRNIKKNNKKKNNYNIKKYFSSNKEENNNQQDGGVKDVSYILNNIILKTHKQFKKLKQKHIPDFAKISKKFITNPLNSTGINKINMYINDIITIEKNRIYIFNNKDNKDENYNTNIKSIEAMENKYGSLGFQYKIPIPIIKLNKNSIGGIDKRGVKVQDYIRKKLMEETNFDSEKKLRGQNLLGMNKDDSIIRQLNEYRKIEMRINKCYKKIQIQFFLFIETMPLECDELTKYKEDFIPDDTLKNDLKIPPYFDYTICTGYESIQKKLQERFKTMEDELLSQIDKKQEVKSEILKKLEKNNKKNNNRAYKKIKKDI